MKVLFISSGRNGNVSVIVRNQGESLKAEGIEIDYFLVKPGLSGYISSIPKIRRTFRKGKYDLAHAHYSLSGFVAALAGCKPLIVSLMGSDVLMSIWFRILIRFFYRYLWDGTIVKTDQMKLILRIHKANVNPNGVDLSKFIPMTKSIARQYVRYYDKRYFILFISGLNRPEKNIELAKASINLINDKNDLEFRHIYNIPNYEVAYYLNAADVLLLTSKWEGSANVLKEAMACNCPAVSTNVGDVNLLFDEEPGYYVSEYSVEDIADKLKQVLSYSKNTGKTKGRDRILKLGLDSETISKRIIEIYKKHLSN